MAIVGNTNLGNHYDIYIHTIIIIIYIYTYVFNQYKIDLECCRKYASIIHMDDSMIKENMNLSSLHYLELCSLCIHTTHTCYAVLFAMFFFCWLCEKTQEKWSSNGTTSSHLGDVCFLHLDECFQRCCRGIRCPNRKTSEFCFRIFGRHWNPRSRLLMHSYMRPVFVWGFKTPFIECDKQWNWAQKLKM